MNTHPLLPFRYQLFVASLLAILSLPASASALVMRAKSGPEPVIVQIKESLRLSDDLDASLSDLAQLEAGAGVGVVKWWAGAKLLQLVSFPKDFSEEQAMEVIGTLQLSAAVEKVVTLSAFNLEFKPGDFARAYTPNQDIPEAALRGLDAARLARPVVEEINIAEAVNAPHVPNQIIVAWKPEYAWRADQTGFSQDISDFHHSARAHVVREMTPTPTDLIQVIEFDDPETSLADKLTEYGKSSWVDYAQPNYIYSQYAITPNDTYYTNPGQAYLARIKAPQAWDPLLGGTTGSHSVVVAVADTGANINHPDFVNRIADGRRNFYADGQPINDVTDRDFPTWHGSHVASIIGAEGNNGSGVCPGPTCGYMAGVAWDVNLLIIKTPNSSEGAILAIDYAYSYSTPTQAPAIAFNLSTGWGPSNQLDGALSAAVGRAQAHNMVIVAAAGNGDNTTHIGYNCDDSDKLISPASVPKDNVIAVGATRLRPDMPSLNDTKPVFSNFGKYRVELGAPGGEDGTEDGETFGIIGLTQHPNDPNPLYPPYNKLSGTSFSAPQVVGALALVKSKYSWEDYAGLRDRVLMATEDVPALTNMFRTGGRLDLQRALKPRTLIKNLSTRAKVESGDRIIIGGFVIRGGSCPGNTPCEGLKVVIRGRGPTLPPELNPLPNPRLRLNDSDGKELYTNNDWQDDPAQAAELTALGFAPANANEAAMVQTLQPGSYTVFLESQNTQEGIALFEIYEIRGTTSQKTRLVNLSTRCIVGTGDNRAIAGTILQNPDQAQQQQQQSSGFPKRRILAFGRGPSLEPFGVTDFLPDPYLELHNASTLVVDNDQWQEIDGPSTSTGLEDKLVAAGFMPSPKLPEAEQYLSESAVWPTLTIGSYTAILRDAGNATGIGLIELYEY